VQVIREEIDGTLFKLPTISKKPSDLGYGDDHYLNVYGIGFIRGQLVCYSGFLDPFWVTSMAQFYRVPTLWCVTKFARLFDRHSCANGMASKKMHKMRFGFN
jgi:hypothetical protein